MSNDFINNENIGKPVVSILNTDSLFSQTATFYDKWSIFRFIANSPEDSGSFNVELRKYRIKDDGSREYCDERVSYSLDRDDPAVKNAINSLISAAIQKGVDLNYFRH